MYFKELLEFDFRQVSMKKRMYILKHYILYSYLTGNGLDLSKVYNFMNKVLLVLLYLPGIIKTKMMLKNNKEIADIYYSNKENLNLLVEENILKLGVATFYLNRVNRSGILKAGVIGGNLQNGNYKMDCRFNKNKLIKQIKEIGRLKDKIEFYNLDVLEFQKNIISKIKREKFIFFDPPYYKKGPELYTNFYNHKNHLELYETIRKITKNWIVTYDNCEEIKKIYKKFDFVEFDINYSLENKMKAKEIMIFSKNIKNHDIFIMK